MDNRYMVVTYIQKPTGKYDEVTSFRKNLNKNSLSTAKVILDFKTKKVVKNGLNPSASFEDMLEFYKRVLGEKLDPYLPSESP
jgi:hypothetical protein